MSTSRDANWKQQWEKAETELKEAQRELQRQRPPRVQVSRVAQLDADLLDKDLADILQEPLWKIFEYIKYPVKEKFQLELTTMVDLVLGLLTIGAASNASYGSQIKNLRLQSNHSYQHEKGGKHSRLPTIHVVSYLLLRVVGSYLFRRGTEYMIAQRWNEAQRDKLQRKVWMAVQESEKFWKLLSLVNFLAFLWNARYRGLPERLFGLRLVPATRQTMRTVSFEFLNRQLVWENFTEFVVFILPLLNIHRWKNRLNRHLGRPSPELLALPEDICAVCYMHLQRPSSQLSLMDSEPMPGASIAHIPYKTDCRHVFCYGCVKPLLMADEEGTPCPRCLAVIRNIQPWEDRSGEREE